MGTVVHVDFRSRQQLERAWEFGRQLGEQGRGYLSGVVRAVNETGARHEYDGLGIAAAYLDNPASFASHSDYLREQLVDHGLLSLHQPPQVITDLLEAAHRGWSTSAPAQLARIARVAGIPVFAAK